MDLSIYQIIRGPVFSSKSIALNKKFNKLILDVHPDATTSQIKEALRKVFNIGKVIKVNVVCRQGKIKRVRGKETQRSFRKRAIITLAKDQQTDALMPMNVAHTSSVE